MTVVVLKRSDDERYAELKLSIRDQFAFRIDVYSNTLDGAYNLLENHSTSRNLYSERKSRPTNDADNGGKNNASTSEYREDVYSMKISQMDGTIP